MSAPSTLSEAQHDGWDDSLYRCEECGMYADADEVRFTATERGPVCSRCRPIDDAEGGER
jgi:hypothetical protein